MKEISNKSKSFELILKYFHLGTISSAEVKNMKEVKREY